MEKQNWKLSPSDFAFLWQECKRCFYLKVVRGFPRPSSPMPAIFRKIDLIMRRFFANKPTAQVSSALPPGVIDTGERRLVSNPISVPGRSSTCFIQGSPDAVVSFEDRSYGVLDFKTSEAKGEHVSLYSRQLHAYAYALENAAPGRLSLSPVSKLGLLCVEPKDMVRSEDGSYSYLAAPVWLECPRGDGAFLGFLAEVMEVLDRPEPPPAADNCLWCRYREAARSLNL